MVKRKLLLFTLVLGSTILLPGAWTGSSTPNTQNPEVVFVSQNVALDADIIGSGIDATQLLEKALEKLGGPRTAWMKTKIRQTIADADSNFIAEGFLQRGPNHCARLEMNIGRHGRLRVVSDGEVVAQVRNIPGKAPDVVVERFPDAAADSADNHSAIREKYLCGKSCGGPTALLQQLRQHLQEGKLQTGLLQGMAVIQVKGEIDPGAMPMSAGTTMPVRYAYIYLDAKTLWPHRLEWWGRDKTNALRSVLRLEFLEPQIDQELSPEACMRMFSYEPNDESAR
jgi:hypothetical protein